MLAQGFLDPPGIPDADALVDRQCLLPVRDGVAGVAVPESAAPPTPAVTSKLASASAGSTAGEVPAAGEGSAAAAATRALPRDIGSFTGRGAELAHLAARPLRTL